MTRRQDHFQPLLKATVAVGSRRTSLEFLVDTGAAVSIARRYAAWSLLGSNYQEKLGNQPIPGVLAVNGSPISGTPIEVDLDIPRLGRIQETLWFADVAHNVLGSHRWFELVGAKFENFPHTSTGRRFGLHHRYRD